MKSVIRLVASVFGAFVFLVSLVFGVMSVAVAEEVAKDKGVQFKEGVHYFLVHRVGAPKSDAQPEAIHVTEFFSYGCPHCFSLEPHLTEWLARKPADVNFTRVPAVWSPAFKLLAKAYYTADLLNVDHAVHTHIFQSIHRARKDVRTAEGVKALLTDFGVASEDVEKTFDSFGVDQKMRSGEQAFGSYRIKGKPAPKDRLSSVPLIVVADRYLTGVSNAGGHEELLELMDFLVERVRVSRGQAQLNAASEPEEAKAQEEQSGRFLGLM